MTSEMTYDDLVEMECDELRTQRKPMTDEEREANLAELVEVLGGTRPREVENVVRFVLGFVDDQQVAAIHATATAFMADPGNSITPEVESAARAIAQERKHREDVARWNASFPPNPYDETK